MQEPPSPRTGAFLGKDEIPETLLPVLKRMMREQGPCLGDLVEKLAVWKDENPGVDIPRIIGMHAFTVEGKTGERIIIPYTQWMLQRAADFLAGLDGGDRRAADQFLKTVGGEFLSALTIRAPVKRENHRLVWA